MGAYCKTIFTPVGPLTLECSEHALTALRFGAATEERPYVLLDTAAEQLLEYFSGGRQTFDLPMSPEGTDFQRTVWQALLTIPFGKTISYRELAVLLGRPTAARAVGMANHRNPLPILIPCHRVIGSNGQLTGYIGGVDVKAELLALEQSVLRAQNAGAPL